MQKIKRPPSATNERRQNYRKYKGFENNPLHKKDSNLKLVPYFLIEKLKNINKINKLSIRLKHAFS